MITKEKARKIVNNWFCFKRHNYRDEVVPFDLSVNAMYSKKEPETLEQAWQKTFAKWYVIAAADSNPIDHYPTDACGLCNMYYCYNCRGCPIYKETNQICCGGTPIAVIEENDVWTPELILREIIFLCKIARKSTEDAQNNKGEDDKIQPIA